MLMSVSSTTSFIRTIAETETEPSLTESSALCECASIIPGVTYIPVASMTLAFAPARTSPFLPTAAILPSRIRIDPPSITPCEAVMIVAFLIRTSPLFCACATNASARMSAVNKVAECLFIVISFRTSPTNFSLSWLPERAHCGVNDKPKFVGHRAPRFSSSWCARTAEIRVISHRVHRAANRIAVNRAFPGDGHILILNLRGEGEAQFIAAERSAEREGSERRSDFSTDRRAFLFEVECQLDRPLRRFRSDRPTACGSRRGGFHAGSSAPTAEAPSGPGLRGRGRFDFVGLAVNEDVFDLRAAVEEVAARDDDVGDLALLDAPQLFGHAEDFRRVDGHRLDRLVLRQTGFDGFSGVCDVIGGPAEITRLEREAHAGLAQRGCGGRRCRAVAQDSQRFRFGVFQIGRALRVVEAQQHRDVLLFEQVCYLIALQPAGDHEFQAEFLAEADRALDLALAVGGERDGQRGADHRLQRGKRFVGLRPARPALVPVVALPGRLVVLRVKH